MADRPFLLILSHYAVHTPVQAPPDEIAYWAQQLPQEKKKRIAMQRWSIVSIGRSRESGNRWNRPAVPIARSSSSPATTEDMKGSPITVHCVVARGCCSREE